MIYLKLKEKPKTIKELLTNLFSYCKSSDIITSVRTYKNPECTKLECHAGLYRSIDAVVEIVKTYFPDSTDKEIFNTLINLKVTSDDDEFIKEHGENYYVFLQMIDCGDIEKPTMYFTSNPDIYLDDYDHQLENSEYSWQSFLSECNIDDQEDLDHHFNNLMI